MMLPLLVMPIGSEPPIKPAPSIVLSLVNVLVEGLARKDVSGDMITFPEPVRMVGWVRITKNPLLSRAIVPVLLMVPWRLRFPWETLNIPALLTGLTVPVPVVFNIPPLMMPVLESTSTLEPASASMVPPLLLMVFWICSVPPALASSVAVLPTACPERTRGFAVSVALIVPWLLTAKLASPINPDPAIVDWLTSVVAPLSDTMLPSG